MLALWSLCFLSIFAINLGFGVRQKLISIQVLGDRDNLHFIAEAGAKQAISQVKGRPRVDVDALNQGWANNEELFKDIELGLGSFSASYNYLDFKSKQEYTRYGLIDEERKINLNKTDLETIQNLLIGVVGLEETVAQNLAASIVDWRDDDSELSVPLGSAEDSTYRNLDNPYEAKDADFEIFEEFLLVKGMTQEVLDKLRIYTTIYSNGKININTVSFEVLLALGLDDDLVGKIIDFRCGEDETEATGDDNIFSATSGVTAQLSEFSPLAPSELSQLSNLVAAGKFTVASENFTALITAELPKRNLELICVFNQGGKILSWREN